jgi:hypothetical protein
MENTTSIPKYKTSYIAQQFWASVSDHICISTKKEIFNAGYKNISLRSTCAKCSMVWCALAGLLIKK